MRLTPFEIDAINAAARDVFGTAVVVRLFGSRVHDHLRGGDIDLVIEVEPGQDRIGLESRFRSRLFDRIDERKIDVVFVVRGRAPSAFARHALSGAQLLT